MSGVGSSSITSSLLAEKAASFATLSRILGYSSVSILFSCIKTLQEVQEDSVPGIGSKQADPNVPCFPQGAGSRLGRCPQCKQADPNVPCFPQRCRRTASSCRGPGCPRPNPP